MHPRGLFLNAVEVTCSQAHIVTKLPRPRSRRHRFEMESELGRRIWSGEDCAYLAGDFPGKDRSIGSLGCGEDPKLHLFLLREALLAHAQARRLDAWFGFGGQLSCVGLPGETVQDGFRIQPVLRLQLVSSGFDSQSTVLVARHSTRWLVDGSLVDPQVRSNSINEFAVRIAGEGPRRGKVVGFEGDDVLLQTKEAEERQSASQYTVAVNFAFIRRHYGSTVLRRLQVTSGSLTSMGTRNRFAVKHRFAALSADLTAFGFLVDLPGGGQARLEPKWIDVEIQEEE
jgi:hypothetical protein